ncbi:MAG: fused MFS/spermidine synthase [Pirellulaceae bacterium]|nr:fused MFS/spermidine synthase [Pirellulaceae bacterium]
MSSRVLQVAGLLFVSGLCALVFQSAWLRDFRLIFGSSTPASAAVLAIFMGGLGLGNAILGRRADRAHNPLKMYAQLELGISVATLASPLLMQLARSIYLAIGGQSVLGLTGATLARLALSALVLGLPTFLMGGTLAAAARAVTRDDDHSRGNVGLLYGLNTLGAVCGAVLSTFWLLEAWGTWSTLCAACALNILNAVIAWRLAGGEAEAPTPDADRSRNVSSQPRKKDKKHRQPESVATTVSPSDVEDASPTISPRLLYFSAGLVGFAFLLMELVWYRMLAPILGGTAFTFGLILAVALAGIGLGGALYPLAFRDRRPDVRSLSLTLVWEAVAIALPFALGDRLAILAAILRQLAYYGFAGQVLGWLVIALIVVFPAALVSGIQFPLLIALFGEGKQSLGRHIGNAYAWNTVGAMLGSLAGGFGFLPLLSAPGAWQAVVILLTVFALLLLVTDYRRQRAPGRLWQPLGLAALAAICLGMTGPTAVWRHSGIGAGRARIPPVTHNGLRSWTNDARRQIVWQADGSEASVAISGRNGASFLVNGKSDGNSLADAGTQIMLTVLGAMLHPEPKQGLVIGLGTGESAGWLASLPTVEHVDVVELEPAIAAVADLCSPLNHSVLTHPKVRIEYNDAREALQTTRQRYDLIASEPSNPYRSGVASLYTREFYRAARQRLSPGGIFVQWLQGYEIDAQTIRTVLTTLHSEFPYVEIWEARPADLLLICSTQPLEYDLAHLASRVAQPEYRAALRIGWRTGEVEGVLAHLLADYRFAARVADDGVGSINTDDRNVLEYSFARTVGQPVGSPTVLLRNEALTEGYARPARLNGADWDRAQDLWFACHAAVGEGALGYEGLTGERATRAKAWEVLPLGRPRSEFVKHWEAQSQPARDVAEVSVLALAYADAASDKALPLIDKVRVDSPVEADALAGLLAARQKRYADAAKLLEKMLLGLRQDPTGLQHILQPALDAVRIVADGDPSLAPALSAALAEPFAALALNEQRISVNCSVAGHLPPPALAEAVSKLEPFVPWDEPFLRLRYQAYEKSKFPLENRARRELLEFLHHSPDPTVLKPRPAEPAVNPK